MKKPMLPVLLAAVCAAALLVSGCVPLVVAGAAGGAALVATDRRSAGTQLDDEAIELKISNNIGAGFGDRVHVNATSYNGRVLLTGEVPTADLRDQIVQIVRTTAKVRRVVDELAVMPVSSIGTRTNDSYITSKVKARFVEANSFPANRVKVVTEREVVYLMGLVTHAEGDAAAQIAATTSGVVRVVKLFEYID
jgi:osmotically-inducible protein OsmY